MLEQLGILEDSLRTYFNYDTFRLGQKEIIQDILKGNDVLGILPTGSGKSLCYQLPAKILGGTTIVVSPLISLMMDQVKELKANNFKEVIALNSFMEYKDRRYEYRRLANYKLIYVSPELLQQKELLEYLKQINVSLFVIDEAHCISQWGHEFRPDYLKLDRIVKQLKHPPILALSATVTRNVQQDIITSLKRQKIVKHIYPIDRENIVFCVSEVANEDAKILTLINLLAKYNVPTLIYFSSRKETQRIAQLLSDRLPMQRISFYHGGMEQMDRVTIQQQFMNNQLDVICCTSAFGMGINKNNIRLTIHYHFSPQLESYIQEVGRSGRDGKSSLSLLLYSKQDEYLPKMLINKELPTKEDVKMAFQKIYQLFNEGRELPTSEDELEKTFLINQVQWRFLHNQLESNGIIKENQIFYDKENWKHAFLSINNHREERLLLKQSKLDEMIEWMNEKRCLRKHLYKKFQSTYKEPNDQCCSNCGFSVSNWKPEEANQMTERYHEKTWRVKLKNLLLIGEDDEEEPT